MYVDAKFVWKELEIEIKPYVDAIALGGPVEARLLLKKIGGGQLGSLFLQREMHAFMAAVLLRMAGLDPFDADAQAQPPHRELAKRARKQRGRRYRCGCWRAGRDP